MAGTACFGETLGNFYGVQSFQPESGSVGRTPFSFAHVPRTRAARLSLRPGEFTETRHQWQRKYAVLPFSGRSPKTLDPAVSYSSDETAYVYSIYEPPYQYHYLKRPYEVVPLTAVSLAAPRYFDKAGRELPQNADPSLIAESRYSIPIRSGIRFAPHPAFAKTSDGKPAYFDLAPEKAAALKESS